MIGMAGAMFPTGWGSSTIASVCKSSSFNSGVCTIGKSYVLAGVSACDAVVMAVLAFILAYRQVTLLPWSEGKENIIYECRIYIKQSLIIARPTWYLGLGWNSPVKCILG